MPAFFMIYCSCGQLHRLATIQTVIICKCGSSVEHSIPVQNLNNKRNSDTFIHLPRPEGYTRERSTHLERLRDFA